MHVLIIGGTGFIGRALKEKLNDADHSVIVTTRRESSSENELTWNPPDLIPSHVIEKFDAIVNLAGESVFAERWSEERKEKIRSSRVDTTRILVRSIKESDKKPATIFSSSAIGIYGAHGDEDLTEATAAGSDFLAKVCKAWEEEVWQAGALGLRIVIGRFGLVLGSGGGALSKMIKPFKSFLGGYIGSGRQWLSWVHIDDITGFIRYALENESLSGIFNVSSPNPVRNREFGAALGKALHRPSLLPVPAIALKLALGEFGEILQTGQRVMPKNTLNSGYEFQYTDIHEALRSIIQKR